MLQRQASNEVNLDGLGATMPSVVTNVLASNVGRWWCDCGTVAGDSITAQHVNHRIGESLLIGAKGAAICQGVLNLEECEVINLLHFFASFCDISQRHRETMITGKRM